MPWMRRRRVSFDQDDKAKVAKSTSKAIDAKGTFKRFALTWTLQLCSSIYVMLCFSQLVAKIHTGFLLQCCLRSSSVLFVKINPRMANLEKQCSLMIIITLP